MTDLRNTCKDSNEYIKKLVVEYKENYRNENFSLAKIT